MEYKAVSYPTIFYKVLNNAELPKGEKTDAYLSDEAQLIMAAGLIIMLWVLSVASYYMAAQPKLAAVPQLYDWRQLEKVPFLYGVVHEAMRLAHSIITQDPQLALDAELQYGKWVIPRNTPVSMTTYDILMNDKLFLELKAFQPDCWIDHPELDRYFVPFGKGSRQCIGIK